MAFIKFNKAELVNLSYSLKREILLAGKGGAYCNTSIVCCNTRRYHGLLAAPVDAFGGQVHLFLSSLDESIVLDGKQFNLGIHRYGDIYEPRGHKYIIDFDADPVPQIVYRIGEIVLSKRIVLDSAADRVMVRYDLLQAPGRVDLLMKPFLAFRDIHALTAENPAARTEGWKVPCGSAWCLYDGFPPLYLQYNTKEVEYTDAPCWYKNITYSDEARRGFACREDLFVPGTFTARMHPGDAIVFCAGTEEAVPSRLKRRFDTAVAAAGVITDGRTQLLRCADTLKRNRGGRKQITAGFSWLYTGLLRETLSSIAGLTLYADGGRVEFEEILDNLIEDNSDRLYRRTTQVEAPLCIPIVLQQYIDSGADPKAVWKKYGGVVREVLRSYLPGRRQEVTMHPNGLLWAQLDGWALSWMNAYVDGHPVTERAGYQVETNAFWYNAIRFALEQEGRLPARSRDADFIATFSRIREKVESSFQPTFWDDRSRLLADYVDGAGRHLEVRPNGLLAIACPFVCVEPEVMQAVLATVDRELRTARGIRTLSPRDENYKGVYEGTQRDRDLAYHNGCTRPFLLGPYVDVCFRIKGPGFRKKAEWLVEGFFDDLGKHGVGAFSELYDGDPPHEAHGAISSALSTAALLQVGYLIDKYREDKA